MLQHSVVGGITKEPEEVEVPEAIPSNKLRTLVILCWAVSLESWRGGGLS